MTALTLNFWLQWLGLLAVEAAAVVLVAAVGQRVLRSAVWRRTLWQASLVALAGLLLCELSGAAGGAVGWLRARLERPQPAQPRSVAVVVVQGAPAVAPAVDLADLPPPEPVPRAPQVKATWWPATIWLPGTVGLLAYALAVRLVFGLCRSRRRRATDAALLARTAAVAARLRLARRVRVWEADKLPGPVSFGLVRPAIGLPVHFTRDFSPAQQEAMLAHELAHLAAHDPAWQALADMVVALLWWHPLVWWARRQWRAASETAADEASLLVEEGPHALAECLVALGGRLVAARSPGWLGMGGGGFRSGLGRRVERLIALGGRPWRPISVGQRWAAGLIAPAALMAVVVASTAWSQPRAGAGRDWKQSWSDSLAARALVALAPRGNDGAPPPSPAEPSDAPNRTPAANGHPASGGMVVRDVTNTLDRVPMLGDLPILSNLFRADGNPPAAPRPRPDPVLNQGGTLDSVLARLLQVADAAPSQVGIQVKWCEIRRPEGQVLDLKAILGGGLTNLVLSAPQPEGTNPGQATATCILRDEEFRALLRRLERRDGYDVMNAPSVTTLSGRQTQIKVTEIRYVVTGLNASTNPAPARDPDRKGETVVLQPIAEPIEVGPILDLVPVVGADRKTIEMGVVATTKEFIGYDDAKGFEASVRSGTAQPATAPTPLPRFRLRQVATSSRVLDGRTLVLYGGTCLETERVKDLGADRTDKATGQPIGQYIYSTNHIRKDLLVFITPTLLDPAGNRVHAPE